MTIFKAFRSGMRPKARSKMIASFMKYLAERKDVNALSYKRVDNKFSAHDTFLV